MKKVDRLLLKAAAAIEGFSFVLFPADDDLFIEALGVDPEKYKHISRDGKVGYDFLAALSEIAAETWDVPMADSPGGPGRRTGSRRAGKSPGKGNGQYAPGAVERCINGVEIWVFYSGSWPLWPESLRRV